MPTAVAARGTLAAVRLIIMDGRGAGMAREERIEFRRATRRLRQAAAAGARPAERLVEEPRPELLAAGTPMPARSAAGIACCAAGNSCVGANHSAIKRSGPPTIPLHCLGLIRVCSSAAACMVRIHKWEFGTESNFARAVSLTLKQAGDLTNCSIPNSQFSSEVAVGLGTGRFFRMRIENWELRIGQILPILHSAELFLREPLN